MNTTSAMTVDPYAPVPIGTTGVAVTRLGMGMSHLSGAREAVSEQQAHATILRALKLGIRHFDVAPAYGLGEAERRLGRTLALARHPDVVVSTKVGWRVNLPVSADASDSGVEAVYDFSRDGVLASLNESLERLGTDRVEIALIHDPDEHWPEAVNHAYPTLAQLQDEGVVGAIGVGMTQAEMLTRFARETDIDIVLCAGRYGLMDHSAAHELFPTCLNRGIAVLVAGVLHNGLLVNPHLGARYNYRTASAEEVGRAMSIHSICARHGVLPGAAAVQFALAHPAVTSLVAGAASPEQLVEFTGFINQPVPRELWRELQEAGHIPAKVLTPE